MSKTIDTGITEQDLLDAVMQEVASRHNIQPPPPGAFTVNMFMERFALKRGQAEDYLKKDVHEGKLKRQMYHGAYWYYRAD